MTTGRFPLGLLLATLGACTATAPRDLTDLDLAVSRWEAAELVDYEFEMRVVCFCPPEYLDWHRVRVGNGAIVAVANAATGQPVPQDRWDEWYTVPEIFDRIRQFIASDIYGRVEASYHPALGFPQDANLIAHQGVADAGMTFQVRAFAPSE